MKLKKTVIFNLYNLKKSIFIYYGILLACIAATSIIKLLNKDNGTMIGGLEMTTVTFLFVLGLSSFRSELYLFLQNGVSRKTTFYSYCISSAILVAIMAFAESIFYSLIGKADNIQTGFLQIYGDMEYGNFVNLVLITFGWSFTLYFAASIFGFFLAALYYRMNKALKLVVSIGVPVSIVFVLPLVDEYVTNGELRRIFMELGLKMAGIGENMYYPGNWMISCLLIAVVFATFAYLLIKKAMVKSR